MKLSRQEKAWVGSFIILFAMWIGSLLALIYQIEQAGGLRAVVISAGRSLKAIIMEILK